MVIRSVCKKYSNKQAFFEVFVSENLAAALIIYGEAEICQMCVYLIGVRMHMKSDVLKAKQIRYTS